MAFDLLFSGSAIRPVDGEGRLVLPGFVLWTLRRRFPCGRLVLGIHEVDPCITGHDEAYGATLYAEVERRRLQEELFGIAATAHHSRTRRLFGAVEHAGVDEAGSVRLPPMMRRRSDIGARALFVGTGPGFEIWDPARARASPDAGLRELTEEILLQETGEQ